MNESAAIQKLETNRLSGQEIKAIQLEELEILKEVAEIADRHEITYYLAYGTAIGAVRHQGFIPWDTDIDIIVDIDSYAQFEAVLERELPPRYKLKSYQTDKSAFLLFSRVILRHELGIVIHVDLFPMVGAPTKKRKQALFIKSARVINQLFFIKQVNPNINYQVQKKKRLLAKVLKLLAFPIPLSLLIYSYNKLAVKYPVENATYLFNLGGTYGYKELILKEWLSEPVYLPFETENLPMPKDYEKYLTYIYGDYMTPIVYE